MTIRDDEPLVLADGTPWVEGMALWHLSGQRLYDGGEYVIDNRNGKQWTKPAGRDSDDFYDILDLYPSKVAADRARGSLAKGMKSAVDLLAKRLYAGEISNGKAQVALLDIAEEVGWARAVQGDALLEIARKAGEGDE